MLLVIDHRDSFTWNLVHALGCWGEPVEVVQGEEMTAESVRNLAPRGLLLSAGPGRPEEAQPTLALVRELHRELPMLGICLGHQILCHAFGARVVHAPEVRHGRTSLIHHDGSGVFAGLPSPIPAARYHSLVVDVTSLPASLVPNAFAETGELMGVRHRELPLWSVQFHPESFLTPHGKQLTRAFVELACGAGRAGARTPAASAIA
jgi:anthranilate synthase/aminodeoxychorismate synthase-like glutamine amidotransferase